MSNGRIDQQTAAPSIPNGAAFLLEIDPDVAGTRAYRRAPASMLGVVTPATTTAVGNQDNFDFSGARVLFCNNATLLTLRGLLAGVDGQLLTIVSKGTGQVDIANQNTNSTAANRVINQVTATISLAAGVGRVTLVYDGAAARWRVLEHEQGNYISPAYDAGIWTSFGGGTWTVESGDVTSFAYYLRGRMLHLRVVVTGSSSSGTLSTLRVGVPGGFVIAAASRGWLDRERVGTDSGYGHFTTAAADTALSCFYDSNASNWPAATNALLVAFNAVIGVQ